MRDAVNSSTGQGTALTVGAGTLRPMDPRDMRKRVEAARVARLATVAADGRPRLVPIVFVLEGDTLYTAVDEKPKRTHELARLADVEAHPDVAVLVDEYDEDWTRLWWVRLRGTGRVLRSGPERHRAIGLLATKYPQHRAERPRGAVLAVEVTEWRGWSASRP